MAKLYNYNGNEITLEYPGYTMPEHFGAVGDGQTNDTNAIQNAFNSGGLILFEPNKKYRITSDVRLTQNTIVELNGATLLFATRSNIFNFNDGDSYGEYDGNGNIEIRNGYIIGACISFIHGENIKLTNVNFSNALGDHFLQICACKKYVVERCSFKGMKNLQNAALEYINIDTNASYPAFPSNTSGQNDPVFYDMSTNKDVVVRSCYFSVGEGEYAYGFNAVGVHSRNVADTYAENITITNNIIRGFTLCGVRVNAMKNAYISENDIRVVGDGIKVGDVADCIGVVIKGNYIDAESGNDIALTSGQYTDLTVAYNVNSGINDID